MTPINTQIAHHRKIASNALTEYQPFLTKIDRLKEVAESYVNDWRKAEKALKELKGSGPQLSLDILQRIAALDSTVDKAMQTYLKTQDQISALDEKARPFLDIIEEQERLVSRLENQAEEPTKKRKVQWGPEQGPISQKPKTPPLKSILKNS
jgi:chromosome segregation ATPase